MAETDEDEGIQENSSKWDESEGVRNNIGSELKEISLKIQTEFKKNF